MSTLMLVNPAKRRRRKTSTRSKKRTTRRRNPARRKTRTIARRAAPVRRRRRATRRVVRRRNPARRGGMMNRVMQQQIMPAATQAAGAIVVDVAYGYLGQFIPPQFSEGPLRHLTKGVGAIVISAVVGNFTRQKWANDMAKGALTVVMHDAAKEMLGTMMPQLPLGYYSPAFTYPSGGMGYYQQGSSQPQLSPETGFTPGVWGNQLGAYIDPATGYTTSAYDSSVEW